jgi:hypothetical protein
MSAPNSSNSVSFKDDVFKSLRTSPILLFPQHYLPPIPSPLPPCFSSPTRTYTNISPSAGKTTTNDESVNPDLEDESAIDEREHRQDWTRTTDPKDTWAERERRRSSVWTKLEPVTSIGPKNRTSIISTSPKKERSGSILSLWTHGVDKSGKHVIHSGFEHDEEDEEEWNK